MGEIKLNYETMKGLLNEITGITEKDKLVFRGFLTQNINHRLKYDLTNYGKELINILNQHDDTLNKLFDEYGHDDEHEGKPVKIIVKFVKDENGNDTEELTENFKNFTERYDELSRKEYETFFNKITKEELEFKSEEYYPLVYEFLVKNEPQ